MIINALARYYDCLKNIPDSPLPPRGYSKVNIDYIIVLNDEGRLVNILPHTKTVTEKGKPKEVPITEILPERISETAVIANFLEHRPVYIFGMEFDKEFCITEKSKKSFLDYQEKAKIFKEVNSPIAQALYKFSINWKSENEIANFLLKQISKSFNKAKFTYCLETNINALACYDSSIKELWEELLKKQAEEDMKLQGYCSICGEYLSIAEKHDKIMGIFNGNPSGVKVTVLKNKSEESYSMTKGQVASVSTEIMKKYTAAFNTLTESPYNHTCIGDVTLLFWAESDINPLEIAQAYIVANNLIERTEEIEDTNKTVKKCLDYIRQGKPFDESSLALLDTKFYVLGVKPNNSRLTIKFFYANTFGKTLENAKQHYDDLKLYDDQKIPSISKIIDGTISPKSSNEDPNPALVSGLFSAVINGGMYPVNLLSSIIRRIKTDQDTDKNKFVNDTRISVIKAYLSRNQRIFNKGEKITMSLNKTNVNPAYLCGRLFAVLEKLQVEAIPGANAGIKSRYFSSACTTPAMVFPRLVMLAQHHIAKHKNPLYLEILMSEIMGNLNESFPKKLDIEEQGKFILGYYQQNKDLYTKKEDR